MHELPNFNYLKSMGARANYVKNNFATLTFPNHWSLVTGMYEETHGIISNSMWDPVLKKTFSLSDSSSHNIDWFGQNKLTEPIWVTNQKAGDGRRSAAGWPGSNLVFQNQVTIDLKYRQDEKFKDLVDKVIALFVNEHAPVNFAALYFNEPGKKIH
jgi:predicted AlkP superfamily pyrophosphatase or phosphodiesterase